MDEAKSESFNDLMNDFENPSPKIKAYRAVSEALLARVLWNPFSKLAQVRKYQSDMESAVALDPADIEIRFLRIAIEYNLPPFLGMSEHVDEDLDFIMANLSTVDSLKVDPSYGNYIFSFLLGTKLCTTDQIVTMKESLGQANSF